MSSERANLKRRLGVRFNGVEKSQECVEEQKTEQFGKGKMSTLTSEPNLGVGTLTQSGCRNPLKGDIKGPYRTNLSDNHMTSSGDQDGGPKNSNLIYIIAAAALLFFVMRSR